MRDAAQLLRDYRQAEKLAARSRELLDAVGRGAALRGALLGELVGRDWPAPMPRLSRQARETLATAERAASLHLAMLADLVGPDGAASMAGVSRQTVNEAYRAMGTSPPPDDKHPMPPALPRRRRWRSRRGNEQTGQL